MTIYDNDDIGNRTWYPLETALTFWLSQIREGTIQAVPEDGGKLREEWPGLFNGDWDYHAPWIPVPYNETMVKKNLDIWDKLVEAIETRMPAASTPTKANQPVYGLLDDNVRNTMNLPQRFAYNFLFRARRPRFKMIAPGLQVITSSDFPDQPYRSYMSKDKDEVPPILLFQSTLNFFEDATWSPQNFDARQPNFFEYHDVKIYPSGLYLLPTDHRRLEDQFVFILPFAIGGNGYARRGDGMNFEGDKKGRGKDSFTELYQPGHQSLEDFQAQGLAGVLESWLGMVERGDWKVDENGVVGDMDTWKEADTEERWEKYVIPCEEPSHHDWGFL